MGNVHLETMEYMRTAKYPLSRIYAHTPIFLFAIFLSCWSLYEGNYMFVVGAVLFVSESVYLSYYLFTLCKIKKEREPSIIISSQGVWIKAKQVMIRWQDLVSIDTQREVNRRRDNLLVALLPKHVISLSVRDSDSGKTDVFKIIQEKFMHGETIVSNLETYWEACK